MRGDEHLGHAAGLHEVEPFGDRRALRGGHRQQLGLGAAAGDAEHPGAERGRRDAGAERDDLARELEPGDVGRRAGRRGVVPRELHEIGAVQAGAVHPYEDLTRPRFGIGAGLHPQLGIGGDHQGPHRRDRSAGGAAPGAALRCDPWPAPTS